MGFLLNREKILLNAETPTGRVMVKENWNSRWLCFDEQFVQTIIDKRKPYKPKLSYIRALSAIIKQANESTLLLGLGGGAVVHYLKRQFPGIAIHAVELNPVVIQVASRFFDVEVPVSCEGAHSFLARSETFARVLVDVYTAIDDHTLNQALLEACYEKARETVSINLLYDNHRQLIDSITQCRQQFSNRTLCLLTDGKSNLVLHGFKRDNYHDEIKQLIENKKIKKLNWDANYGLIGTLY